MLLSHENNTAQIPGAPTLKSTSSLTPAPQISLPRATHASSVRVQPAPCDHAITQGADRKLTPEARLCVRHGGARHI